MAYRPQTDGLTEHKNQWLEQYLQLAVGNDKEWSTLLVLRFYPHFSTFLTHMTPHAPSFSRHLSRTPSMCLQITGFIFAYVALTCIILFAHALVWFLIAVPRLLIMFL